MSPLTHVLQALGFAGVVVSAAGCGGELVCPQGQKIDGSGEACQLDCPTGTVLSENGEKCELDCPAGTFLNPDRNACIWAVQCGDGFVYDAEQNGCVCADGTEPTDGGGCIAAPYAYPSCPSGYMVNAAGDGCQLIPNCGPGTHLNETKDACVENEQDTITFSGFVYDDDTSIPLAGATVRATPGNVTTTTDASGYYELTLPLYHGDYTVRVEAEGYWWTYEDWTINETAYDCDDCESNHEHQEYYDFWLDPYYAPETFTIAGTVYAEDHPANGATVMLTSRNTSSYTIYAVTTTDAEGRFSFSEVENATYYVQVAGFDEDSDGVLDFGRDYLDLGTSNISNQTTSGDDTSEWNLTNLVIQLQGVNRRILATNFVPDISPQILTVDQDFGSEVNPLRLLDGSSNIVMHFGQEVDTDFFAGYLIKRHGNDELESYVPFTASWNAAGTVVTIDPSETLNTNYGDDYYQLAITSFRWADQREVVALEQWFAAGDDNAAISFYFEVGSPPPAFLASPAPELLADVDYNGFNYGDDWVFIRFPEVAGADWYGIWAREKNTDHPVWIEADYDVLTVGDVDEVEDADFTDGNLVVAVRIDNLGFGTNYGMFGGVFGYGNEVEFVVKPYDIYGYASPVTDADARLVVADTVAPMVEFDTQLAAHSYDRETGMAMADVRFDFSEWMDDSIAVAGTIAAGGGRIDSFTAGTPVWSDSDTATYEESTFKLKTGSRHTLASATIPAAPAVNLLTPTELGGKPTNWAIGDTVHVWREAAGPVYTVTPYTIDDITPEGSLRIAAYTEVNGDVLFDPCETITTLSAATTAGLQTLTLASVATVKPGQALTVGESDNTNPQTCTVESITGSVVTCEEAIDETQEVGSTVYDAACERELRDGVRILSDFRADSLYGENFIATTDITTSTGELWFTPDADLSEIVSGDVLLLGTLGADGLASEVTATVTGVATLQNDGTLFVSGNDPNDADPATLPDGTNYVKVTVSNMSGALSAIDPTNTYVVVLMDYFSFTPDASLTDTSGNAVDTSEFGYCWLTSP